VNLLERSLTMSDWETFLTTLYVMADDFCQTLSPTVARGPAPALSRGETVALALLARFRRFAGERDFYRWAEQHLRAAFPTLPHRTQYNRQVRRQQATITRFALQLGELLQAGEGAFEALDRTAAPDRNPKRRGRGWLAGITDYGFSNRWGWYHGFAVLLAVHPEGPITGWGFGSASAKDQPLAEVFFAARAEVGAGRPPCTRRKLPGAPQVCLISAGRPAKRVYLTDKGFQGRHLHRHWSEAYGAEVIAPPQNNQFPAKHPWPRGLRRVLAGMRQIVETVIAKLEHTFGLLEERPHTLSGFASRLAARTALHNFCIWMNRQLGRANLAFADLVDW
jgi:hypothetical protein